MVAVVGTWEEQLTAAMEFLKECWYCVPDTILNYLIFILGLLILVGALSLVKE